MNTGGPAFPASEVGIDQFNDEGREIGCRVFPPSQGMTLLDWFAGQALVSLSVFTAQQPHATVEDVAGDAYDIAEAMLAEKARREALVQESSTTSNSQDSEKMANLEALNRELVWALDIVMFGWIDTHDDSEEVVKARAILAKARGIT